jgi:hypothetical protein
MQSTKIFLKNNPILVIILLFISWRVFLYIAAKITINYYPLQPNFLGGGMANYLSNPLLWGYANFDGEHYLAIARDGYAPLTHFFFPVYPLLTKTIVGIFGNTFLNYVYVSQIVSNTLFLLALIGLYRLLIIDFKSKIVYLTLAIILFFPVSFYFISSYNESLFLFLVVWTFYFARKRVWILAGVLALIASATRVIGIALFFVLLLEIYIDYKKTHKLNIVQLLSLFISPLGLIAYMLFLKQQTGDMLVFLNSVSIFGEQRSSQFVYLPQVFYRYIFKIIPSVGFSYLPILYVSLLELVVGLWLLISSAGSFTKLRLSYSIYLAIGFLIPSFAGSFSSLPRYALVLFPAFLISAVYLIKLPKFILYVYLLLSTVLLIVTQAMFLRGFWIS